VGMNIRRNKAMMNITPLLLPNNVNDFIVIIKLIKKQGKSKSFKESLESKGSTLFER
jgi:hypothetical protein